MYDDGVIGGLVKQQTGTTIHHCNFTDHITSVTLHKGVNVNTGSIIFGFEFSTKSKNCGLMGHEGIEKISLSGHQLLYSIGKFGNPNLKSIDLYFDYGCNLL